MNYQDKIAAYQARLSEPDYQRIKRFVETQYGIKLPTQKKIMVQGRLQKRLAVLGYDNFTDYLNFVFSAEGKKGEIYDMVDSLSTNKTSFFREPKHFHYIKNTLIPDFVKKHSFKTLKAWSAGCSSGEEAYTLAMVLDDALETYRVGYSIWATDISVKMLRMAKDAIYAERAIDQVPLAFKKKYLLKSKDSSKKLVRVKQQLRSHVLFSRLNLMDSVYSSPYTFDIVLLRNVLIYFDKDTQVRVVKKICEKMNHDAHLFLGHSETLLKNEDIPLKAVGPTIYQKL